MRWFRGHGFRLIYLVSLLWTSILWAADAPLELVSSKATFLKEQKTIADEKPEELNESYLKRLRSMSEQAKKSGDTDAVQTLTKEIVSVEKHGRPAAEVSADDTGDFARMRKLYATELARFNVERLARHEELVKQYQAQLDALVVSLTKAGRIEDAVSVRDELKAAGKLTIPSAVGGNSAGNGAVVAVGAPKQGRLRVVGNAIVRSWLPWGGGAIHKEVFEPFDDLVQISGNSSGIMALRSNGHVILESGRIFEDDAYRLFTPYAKFGAVGRDGVFHSYQGKFVPVAQPVLQTAAGFYRDLSLLENGELAWAGKIFDEGKRIPPPPEVRSGVRQIGSNGAFDYVLMEDGEILSWNNDGLSEMPEALKQDVKLIACGRRAIWFLAADHRILNRNGERPEGAPEKAQYIAVGGDLFAVLGMDDVWRVAEIGETVGDQVSLLEAVLNHPATVDVAFHLANGAQANENTAAYVAWIEDPSVKAVPIPVGQSLIDTDLPKPSQSAGKDPPVRSSTATGARFFGIEIR